MLDPRGTPQCRCERAAKEDVTPIYYRQEQMVVHDGGRKPCVCRTLCPAKDNGVSRTKRSITSY